MHGRLRYANPPYVIQNNATESGLRHTRFIDAT